MPNYMPNYIRVPLATEMVLAVLEAACPRCDAVLPLCGSPIAQIGALLLMGVAFNEYADSLKRRPPKE